MFPFISAYCHQKFVKNEDTFIFNDSILTWTPSSFLNYSSLSPLSPSTSSSSLLSDKLYNINSSIKYSIYAVFDGHGGSQSALFCKDNFVSIFISMIEKIASEKLNNGYINLCHLWASSINEAIYLTFIDLDLKCKNQFSESGTTASVVIITFDDIDDLDDNNSRRSFITICNTGDSHICCDYGNKKPILISEDHRISNNLLERQRVIKEGGTVGQFSPNDIKKSSVPNDASYPLRIWPGGLMMSRTIGDADAPQASAIPFISSYFLKFGGRIIIASDGLWDEITFKAASKLTSKMKPQDAAPLLCKEATKAAGIYKDDVTVIVIDIMKNENSKFQNLKSNESEIEKIFFPRLVQVENISKLDDNPLTLAYCLLQRKLKKYIKSSKLFSVGDVVILNKNNDILYTVNGVGDEGILCIGSNPYAWALEENCDIVISITNENENQKENEIHLTENIVEVAELTSLIDEISIADIPKNIKIKDDNDGFRLVSRKSKKGLKNGNKIEHENDSREKQNNGQNEKPSHPKQRYRKRDNNNNNNKGFKKDEKDHHEVDIDISKNDQITLETPIPDTKLNGNEPEKNQAKKRNHNRNRKPFPDSSKKIPNINNEEAKNSNNNENLSANTEKEPRKRYYNNNRKDNGEKKVYEKKDKQKTTDLKASSISENNTLSIEELKTISNDQKNNSNDKKKQYYRRQNPRHNQKQSESSVSTAETATTTATTATVSTTSENRETKPKEGNPRQRYWRQPRKQNQES